MVDKGEKSSGTEDYTYTSGESHKETNQPDNTGAGERFRTWWGENKPLWLGGGKKSPKVDEISSDEVNRQEIRAEESQSAISEMPGITLETEKSPFVTTYEYEKHKGEQYRLGFGDDDEQRIERVNETIDDLTSELGPILAQGNEKEALQAGFVGWRHLKRTNEEGKVLVGAYTDNNRFRDTTYEDVLKKVVVPRFVATTSGRDLSPAAIRNHLFAAVAQMKPEDFSDLGIDTTDLTQDEINNSIRSPMSWLLFKKDFNAYRLEEGETGINEENYGKVMSALIEGEDKVSPNQRDAIKIAALSYSFDGFNVQYNAWKADKEGIEGVEDEIKEELRPMMKEKGIDLPYDDPVVGEIYERKRQLKIAEYLARKHIIPVSV